jgi:hypothetical protein
MPPFAPQLFKDKDIWITEDGSHPPFSQVAQSASAWGHPLFAPASGPFARRLQPLPSARPPPIPRLAHAHARAHRAARRAPRASAPRRPQNSYLLRVLRMRGYPERLMTLLRYFVPVGFGTSEDATAQHWHPRYGRRMIGAQATLGRPSMATEDDKVGRSQGGGCVPFGLEGKPPRRSGRTEREPWLPGLPGRPCGL